MKSSLLHLFSSPFAHFSWVLGRKTTGSVHHPRNLKFTPSKRTGHSWAAAALWKVAVNWPLCFTRHNSARAETFVTIMDVTRFARRKLGKNAALNEPFQTNFFEENARENLQWLLSLENRLVSPPQNTLFWQCNSDDNARSGSAEFLLSGRSALLNYHFWHDKL